ncbi:MAG: hypothetical protein WAP03_08005 [Methylorubrum rhodinum]
MSLAETARKQDLDPEVRTGALAVGTRPGSLSKWPNTDLPAAGAGSGVTDATNPNSRHNGAATSR